MGITVVTLGGTDRFDTSINIAKEMVKLGASVSKVAVAYGWLNQDALSIASIASNANQPILLTEKNTIPASVKAFLAANASVVSTDVIGGTGVISEAVKMAFPNATRHFGFTAYDTNSQVIQDFASSLEFDNVFVANAITGIDALAGAPLAAQTKSAIVLTDGMHSPAVAAFTYSKSTAGTVTTALGGTAVVSNAILAKIAAGQVDSIVGELAIVSVSALTADGRYLDVAFSKAISSLDKSQLKIVEQASGARVGIQAVELSADGMNAELTLYETVLTAGDSTQGVELKSNVPYVLTYTNAGITLSLTFERPGFAQEARVTDVDAENREISVAGYGTLDVPESLRFDFELMKGQEINVWYNSDNDVVKFTVVGRTVSYDAITFNTGTDEIDLIDEDKTYDLAVDADGDVTTIVSVNGVKQDYVDGDISNNAAFDYAKVVFNEDGDVAFIDAYTWADGFVIVESVTDNVIFTIDDDELDVADFVIVKGGMTVAADDLKKGDVVFFNDAADNALNESGFAEVLNSTVTGEIQNVFLNDLEIDGDTYDYTNAVFLDGSDLKTVTGDDAVEFQEGGDATLFLDRNGDVMYITGDQAQVASSTTAIHTVEAIQGYKTAGNEYIELNYADQDGEAGSEVIKINDLDMITYEGAEFDIDADDEAANLSGEAGANSALKLLLRNGTVADNIDVDLADAVVAADAASTDNIIVEVTRDDNGKALELTFLASTDVTTDVELDDNYIAGKRISADTLVFDGTEGYDDNNTSGNLTDDTYAPDDDEITVAEWSELKNAGYTIKNSTVFYDGTGAEYIIVKYTDSEDFTMMNAVITDVSENIDGDIVRVKAVLDGEETTFTVDELNMALEAGDVVQLKVIDDSNLVDDITLDDVAENDYAVDFAVEGTVVAVDLRNDTITLDFDGDIETLGDQVEFELTSDATVADGIDDTDITVESLRTVEVGNTVTVATDEDGTVFVNLVVITAE